MADQKAFERDASAAAFEQLPRGDLLLKYQAGTLDRLFAGGIDVCHNYRVGVIETGAKFLKQIAEPGVAVRLNDGDHFSVSTGAGGG